MLGVGLVILNEGETYLKHTAEEELEVVSLKYARRAPHFLPAISRHSLVVSYNCLPPPYNYKAWSSELTCMYLIAWQGVDAEEAARDLVSGAIPWLTAMIPNPSCPAFFIWMHFLLVLA